MRQKAATTAQRGYGFDHQRARQLWGAVVQAGGVDCSRCGRPIVPGEPWDLDHSEDRSRYNGPAHRRCNRRAGALKKAALARRRRRGRPEEPRGQVW